MTSHALPHGLERAGFATLAACLVAPIVAHGLWRPLGHVFGSAGSAHAITGAALAVVAIGVVAERLGGQRAPWLPAAVAGIAAVALCAALALGVAGLGALLPAAAIGAWILRGMPARLPSALDGVARRHPRLTALYLLAALGSVAWTARLTVFIGDATAVDQQALPGVAFTATHSCLTAYVHAFDLARQGADNLYADAWWHGSLGLPPLPEGAEDPWHPFLLDNFSYPPSFLLVMAPLAALDGDFLAQRALWFGLNGLVAAFGLWAVARWVGGPSAHRVLLLAPLLFGSVPFLLTLQIGNFHVATVVLSVLAMVAFDQGRAGAGGALLGLTILSKISPGILGILLVVRRRAREVALTAGFGALFFALSVAWFGADPLRSFVTFALPRLSSGAAFPFIDTEAGIATNMAPFGFPFKLEILGLELGDPWQVGRWIARLYTLGIVLVAVAGARRVGDRRDQAIRWMGLLLLAAMQSPFCPLYATLALLWATTLLSVEVRRARDAVLPVGVWAGLLVVPPDLPLPVTAVISMVQTTCVIAVAAWLVLRAPRVPEA